MKLGHRHRPSALIRTEAVERDGGYVLVMFAILLIPVMLLAGFSVDVGHWYNRASDMQKAADAAALAGVVWLPDEEKAREVAIETAAKNGFDNAEPDVSVTVSKSTKSPNRLQVTINARVGSFIYSAVGGEDLDMNRTAFAEYVTPVPMGSPRNFFGLGELFQSYTSTGFEPELLYQSVNPYCTNKVQGDRHQSAHINLNSVSLGSCTATPTAPDPSNLTSPPYGFRDTGYELYVDAVEGRPGPIEFKLYDPQFTNSRVEWQTVEEVCNTVWVPSSGWTTSSSSSSVTITGPAQYQTRNSNWGSWSGTQNLAPGDTYTRAANRIRYRLQQESCSNQTTTHRENAIDTVSRNSERYTVSVFGADATPLDDSDNPLICQKDFYSDTPYDSTAYLGSRRFVTMPISNTNNQPCTVSTGATSGKYIVRITNNLGVGNNADGSNQWGIVARYRNASGDGLCDGRVDAMCPRVYGKEAISVYARTGSSTASFFLAEIEPQHQGKKLRLELYDPGEGGRTLQILQPTGADSWAPVRFDWEAVRNNGTTYASADNALSLDISGNDDIGASRFNAKVVNITVNLDSYSPPSNNNWWKIQYEFASTVTDRTTWSARILGDPVHLIEE